MKYDNWNDLLLEYYFGDSDGSPIFLAITKDSLEDLGLQKDGDAFSRSCKILNQFYSEHGLKELTLKEYVWKNFVDEVRDPHNKNRKKPNWKFDKVSLFTQLRAFVNDSNQKQRPMFMPYLALFIMPVGENPEMHGNEYYDRLNNFFRSNNIFHDGNESFGTRDMTTNRQVLSSMWNFLINWAQSNGYDYVRENLIEGSNGYSEYAKMFQQEYLLTASQLERFKILFSRASLMVGEDITTEQVKNILKNAHTALNIPRDQWRSKMGNFQPILIQLFNKMYSRWDGNTIVVSHENQHNSVTEEGSTMNLYIGFKKGQWDDPTFFFDFYSRNPDDQDYHTYSATTPSLHFEDIRITPSGFGNRHILQNDQNAMEEIVNNGSLTLNDDDNPSNKAVFVASDFYLLKKRANSYTSKAMLEMGGHYFVLIRSQKYSDFKKWLEENEAIPVMKKCLGGQYSLYEVAEAKTQMPGYKKLTVPTHKSAQLVDTYKLHGSNSDHSTICLPSNIDAFFEIQGISIAKEVEPPFAVTVENGTRQQKQSLIYDEDNDLWRLSPFRNRFMLSKRFVIKYGTERLNNSTYRFMDIQMPCEESYIDISYDTWGNGQIGSQDAEIVHGLQLQNVLGPDVAFGELSTQMEKAPYLTIPNESYTPTDFLLYALTDSCILERQDLENLRRALLANGIGNNLQGYRTSYLEGDLFRLGYINTMFKDGKHIIAVNKPTLIWLPPRFEGLEVENTNRFGHVARLSIEKCVESKFKCLLTGARTPGFMESLNKAIPSFNISMEVRKPDNPLLPQTVYLWADSVSDFEHLAERMHIMFQKCIYSNTLLSRLSSVKDYREHILTENNLSELDYSCMKDNYQALDYQALAELMTTPPETNGKRDIYKHFGDVNPEGMVTYFPGTWQEATIFWEDGKQYNIQKHWGHFVGMLEEGVKLVHFNEQDYTLELPGKIKLPDMLARALTMVTGELPKFKNGKRIYQLNLNPYAGKTDPDKILSLLGQK